jgi:hypothetical protein
MQILIPLSQTIPGHLDHIAHGTRVRIRISNHDKVEAGVDSTRIFRDHEAHIARMDRDRIRTFKGGKIEAPADLTGIFRAEGRVNSTRISKVKVTDPTVKALDVAT